MAVYFNSLQNDYEAEDIRKFSYVVRNLQSYDFDNHSMSLTAPTPLRMKDWNPDQHVTQQQIENEMAYIDFECDLKEIQAL